MYPQYMFYAKYEIGQNMQLKIVIFMAVKNLCILHGGVFVMNCIFHVATSHLFHNHNIIRVFL